MPNGWKALKCEGCGNQLEPVASVSGIIHVNSREAVEALVEAVQQSETGDRMYHRIPIIGGDFHVEVIKSPLADLLKCSSCGMLYERDDAK